MSDDSIRARLIAAIRESAPEVDMDAEAVADATIAVVGESGAARILASRRQAAECPHRHRCRFVHGYLCEDCRSFFPRESETYRRTEWPDELSMVLHNINVQIVREGGERIPEIDQAGDDLRPRPCPERAIVAAERMVAKYAGLAETATVVLR